MAQGGAFGGNLDVGGPRGMDYGSSTVTFGAINGPGAGQGVSDRASGATNFPNGLAVGALDVHIPMILAFAVLAWWLIREYE